MMLSVSGSILNADLDNENYYMYEEQFDQANGAWWGGETVCERSTNSVRGEI